MKKLYSLVFFAFLLLLPACEEYPVGSVTLDRSQLTMNAGESYHLQCIIEPLSSTFANPTTWKSSDPSVAIVSSSGVVTAVYSGACTITASAGNTKATCEVVVNALEYGFAFERAKALYYGDAYEVGSNNFVLRLLGDGVTMNPDGLLSGEGLFINLDVQLPLTDLTMTAGTYNMSEIRQEYTFMPGQLYEESGTQYAIGTFLGQRTSEGLKVIFVKSGSFWITLKGVKYQLEGHLIGEKEEDIVINFSGLIPVIDKTETNLPETIHLDVLSVKTDFLGDSYHVGLNVFRQKLTHSIDTVLQVEFYVPLSVTNRIPAGTYQFSGSKTYSLVPASGAYDLLLGAWFSDIQGSKKVVGGQVVVTQSGEQQNFTYRLIDEDGRIIDVNHSY